MEEIGLPILLGISVWLIIYMVTRPRKAARKPKKVLMNCELCVRSIGDDVYRIEASWCDTSAKAIGTMQISDPRDVSLGDLVAFIEAARELAETHGDVSERDG
jgi:hypothetical protein